MANKLKVAVVHAIIGLLEQNWSYRRIARELGVHRETVARHDELRLKAGSKPANATPGSEPEESSKPANPTAGSETESDLISDCQLLGPPSLCRPHLSYIKDKLDLELSAQRIWQDLVEEKEFKGSYSSVKRFVRRLGASLPLPFRRMECAPGEEAQVDFGSGCRILVDGKRRKTHVLRIVLSHSRKSYSEAVLRQTTENFIRVIENAFSAFGGVPKTLVIDNLKAAVTKADWYDPDLNPKIIAFARHYNFVFLPTRPYTPRHKGKIENGIKYVKNNALKGRDITSLAGENELLERWERQIADTRIHGTTRKQVGKHFTEVEQGQLMSLPEKRFPLYHEGQRKVHRDGHIEVARSFYSVPPEYLGRSVWAHWDTRLVRVFNDQFQQIAISPRVEPGTFYTNPKHLADAKISSVERGVDYMLGQARRLGDPAGRWATQMIAVRGIEGVRVLQGFLASAKKYPANLVNHVSQKALEGACFRLKPVRELCKRTAEDQKEPTFSTTHPIIRPLTEYQSLLFEQNTKEKQI